MKLRNCALLFFWYCLCVLGHLGLGGVVWSQGLDEFDGFEHLGRFRSVSPTRYCQIIRDRNPLDLSDDQMSDLRALLKPHLTETAFLIESPQSSQDVFDEIMSHLDESQQMTLRQYIRFECYVLKATDQFEDIQNDGGLFFWLHPDVAASIKLTEKQKRIVLGTLSDRKNIQSKLQERHQAFLNRLYTDWQDALEKILLPSQLRLFNEATGANFSFGSNVRKVTRSAYSNNLPLFLVSSEVKKEIRGNVSAWELLLIGEQRLNGMMDLHAATNLLRSLEVKHELKLSDPQLEEIKKIEAEYVKRHPLPFEISWGFRKRGVAFIPTDPKLEVGQTDQGEPEKHKTDADETHAFVEALRARLFDLLDAKQRERWRQIQNHLVLAFGWSEVPLAFPDWPSFLDLSTEQKQEFEGIHLEMEARYRNAFGSMQSELAALEASLRSTPSQIWGHTTLRAKSGDTQLCSPWSCWIGLLGRYAQTNGEPRQNRRLHCSSDWGSTLRLGAS
jgi:hypothetical protein